MIAGALPTKTLDGEGEPASQSNLTSCLQQRASNEWPLRLSRCRHPIGGQKCSSRSTDTLI
jgi:hypothetical protein